MKRICITLLLACTTTIALSQEYQATFGKYPDCLRRGGICTVTTSSSAAKGASGNISFSIDSVGNTILRVYRDKLTKEELDRVLGTPIITSTKNNVQFTLEAGITLPEIPHIKTLENGKQLTATTYPTIISQDYIDIIIVPSEIIKQ